MMRCLPFLARLARERRGAVVIETAIVAPALVLLSLGGFEVSNIVARQSEIQSAAAEAAQIALAAKPDEETEITTVKQVVMASTGLPAGNVTLQTVFRCKDGPSGYVDTTDDCDEGSVAWQYLQITMSDTYTPIWTSFGVGAPIEFNVVRTVMVADT